MCLSLDLVALARRGFFRPGWHEGEAELLSDMGPLWAPRTDIRAFFGEQGGVLTVFFPVEADIRLVRAETSAGHRWKFVCPGRDLGPCGRLTRRLLIPRTPPGVTLPWGCRSCYRVAYRDPGRLRARAAAERLRELLRLRAELDRVERAILGEPRP
jgi:hypothetical protein